MTNDPNMYSKLKNRVSIHTLNEALSVQTICTQVICYNFVQQVFESVSIESLKAESEASVVLSDGNLTLAHSYDDTRASKQLNNV